MDSHSENHTQWWNREWTDAKKWLAGIVASLLVAGVTGLTVIYWPIHEYYSEEEIAGGYYAQILVTVSKEEAEVVRAWLQQVAEFAALLEPDPRKPAAFGSYNQGLLFTQFDALVARSLESRNEWIVAIDLVGRDSERLELAQDKLEAISAGWRYFLFGADGDEFDEKFRFYCLAERLWPFIRRARVEKYDISQYNRLYDADLGNVARRE